MSNWILIGLFTCVLVVGTFRQLPDRFWRDPNMTPERLELPIFWPYSKRSYVAFIRGIAVYVAILWAGLIGLAVKALVSHHAEHIVDLCATIVILLLVVLSLTAQLFSWPSFLVPPGLRKR